MIVTYVNPRSLLMLQYLSSGLHSACTDEANTRLQVNGVKIDFGLTPIQALFCRDMPRSSCDCCGLLRCYMYGMDPSGCINCYESTASISTKMAKEYLHLDASDLTLPRYSVEAAMEIAYEKYGSRLTWLQFAREQAAEWKAQTFSRDVQRRRSEINRSITLRHTNIRIEDEKAIKKTLASLQTNPSYKRYVYLGVLMTGTAIHHNEIYDLARRMIPCENCKALRKGRRVVVEGNPK